jgi:hydroxymethylbilane synthase
VELVPITTDGDVLTGPLAQLGGTGVFVAALRDALAARRVRPRRALDEGPSHGRRRGPRDRCRSAAGLAVCCARADGLTLEALPRRRRRQRVAPAGRPAAAAPPDLPVRGIRGNVDTPLRKVDEGSTTPSCWPRRG